MTPLLAFGALAREQVAWLAVEASQIRVSVEKRIARAAGTEAATRG
ncbi:hypothetical protein ACWCQK_34805 [Streptomyces sp. NPDC002306]